MKTSTFDAKKPSTFVPKIRALEYREYGGTSRMMGWFGPSPGDVTIRPDEQNVDGYILWRRGEYHKKHYRAYRVHGTERIQALNAIIKYHKSVRRWVVYVQEYNTETPRNEGYTTLKAAKASLSNSLLERLAAEAAP